jgi:glycosyltransferase involved in cell wall biosynthesis
MSPSFDVSGGTRRALLYRPSLDLRSGAGQLMLAQLRGLREVGVAAQLACERGALRFWLRTGIRPSRLAKDAIARLGADPRADRLIVDHGLCVPSADVVFVHNLATEACRYVQRADWAAAARDEAAFFGALDPAACVVANSELVKDALLRHFALPAERIVVHYPGFRADRFAPQRRPRLRAAARRALRLAERTPLLGFVTSGDFAKRGLDLFLAAAERVAAARPDARFLVVGSKKLPDAARAHPLVRQGAVHYRPKGARPDLWCSALDVFVYAARFEEFGLVVAEAQALGVPVLTSRRVGAAECLSPEHRRWLADAPEPDGLAAAALELLTDDETLAALGRAGAEHARSFDQRAYVRATLATLLSQNR